MFGKDCGSKILYMRSSGSRFESYECYVKLWIALEYLFSLLFKCLLELSFFFFNVPLMFDVNRAGRDELIVEGGSPMESHHNRGFQTWPAFVLSGVGGSLICCARPAFLTRRCSTEQTFYLLPACLPLYSWGRTVNLLQEESSPPAFIRSTICST